MKSVKYSNLFQIIFIYLILYYFVHRLIAEIPPTGGVIPQSQLQTVKQHSFLSDNSMTNTVIYIFWYVMVVYYNINEISALRRSGIRNYFNETTNILDAVILLVTKQKKKFLIILSN